MNKFLLLISGLMFSLTTQAQNKTFGIGVTTPNPNAALHVESPTNNQGFIMPRITTAQRNAMSASLSTNENGLLVYDSDLKTIFIWNTNFWSLPYKTKFLITDPNSTDSALTAKTYSNQPHGYAISAINKGTGDVAGFFLVDNPANNFASIYGEHRGNGSSGFFLNNNPNNPSTTLMAISPSIVSNTAAIAGTMSGNNSLTSSVYGYHSGAGAAGGFVVDNATNNQTSLWATTNGTGSAGAFNITNAADTYPALYAATTGTGAAIAGETSTGYAAIQGRQSNATGIHNAFQGLHDGAGQGHAGLFQLTNAANNYPAIQAETAGAGPGIRVFQGATSLGGGIDVQLQNPTASTTGVNVGQLGTGPGGIFIIDNTSNIQTALYGQTNGSGTAVAGLNIGTGPAGYFQISNAVNNNVALTATTDGTQAAGNFTITNAANTNTALYATTNGSGVGIGTTVTGTGGAGNFTINNPSNSQSALYSNTNGTGTAGYFQISNTASNGIAISATTNGLQAAGDFTITNASNPSTALYATTNGSGVGIGTTVTGTGGGGNFTINNSSNSQSAIYASTNGTGQAASFNINNSSSSASGISSVTNSSGAGIYTEVTNGGYAAIDAKNSGASGIAGQFNISGASNASSAVQANTAGTGSSGNFAINNATNSSTALNGTTNGTGSAGYYGIANPANTFPALYATTNGTGAALQGVSTGSGNSIAGLFTTTNSANNYPAVQAVVAGNAANGIYVNHQGTGGNLIVLTNNDVAAARIDKTGKGFFNSGTQTGGADLAEMFDVEGLRNDYEPGDVLVISEATDRTVEKSSEPNSTKVAGVYATKPGVTLTEKGIDENIDQLVPMGVIGVIPTKVCSENGSIKRGDLLVTSSTRGHAMKAIPVVVNGVSIYPTGAVLGKALENFNGAGTGVIKVLVNVK